MKNALGPRVWLVAGGAALAVAGQVSGVVLDAPPTGLPPVTWTGPDSRVTERRCERIASEARWETVWREHLGVDGDASEQTEARPPVIDWAAFEIVAVFDGTTVNSRGMRAWSVVPTEDGGELRWIHLSYQTMGGSDHVTPYGFFLVPRTAGPIRVVEGRGIMGSDPPAYHWRERAVLPPAF